jgi:hypothetical protein
MKHLLSKLLIVVFLVLGISSFVALKSNGEHKSDENSGNVRFNSEMDNGFADRE